MTRRGVGLSRPGRNEAAARWVAPISRGGPFWAPGGGGGEAGRHRARPGSPLRQPLLAAPRQYQPGLIRSSMLVPGSTRPSSEKRQVRATCRRSEKGKAGVSASLEARKVGCQPQPGQAEHEKCRARASCAGELQLWVPVCERGCQLPAQGARKSHLCADQCVLRKHCYRGYRSQCPVWCVT